MSTGSCNQDLLSRTLAACFKQAQEREESFLHKKGAYSRDHVQRVPVPFDHRLPYTRDVDRIIHSKAYTRYLDKTQVIYLVEDDHITHRWLHVQFVNLLAREIGRALNLNIDLIEAIALGHDVGHPPFGHEGEGYLSVLSEKYGNGPFTHSWQSCHLLSAIEPLNLGLAVYDGFLSHDGGLQSREIHPVFSKSWGDHERELRLKKENPDVRIFPTTLEGCLVKLSDTISYIGKDIEDALRLKLIDSSEIPDTCLGQTNRQILNYLTQDVIAHSLHRDYIALSQESFDALRTLRQFNFEKIYSHPKLKRESKKIEKGYASLFDFLFQDFVRHDKTSLLWSLFLHDKSDEYLRKNSPAGKVVDFISGMTDHYFIRLLQQLTIPSLIEVNT